MQNDESEMTAEDVIAFVRLLEQHQIGVCLDGTPLPRAATWCSASLIRPTL